MELTKIEKNEDIKERKTKKIPKNDKTDCLTNKGKECSFYESVTECPNPPKGKIIHHINDSKQIVKNENNVNKQVTQNRYKKHKNYLQSKRDIKKQSNKEEHEDVHQWPNGTILIIGNSMVWGLKEDLLSNKKQQVKVRRCRDATVEDMFDYVKPVLKRKPGYVVLHVGTNNPKDMSSRKILDKRVHLKAAVLDSHENFKGILLQAMAQVDDGKAYSTISKLNDLLQEVDISIVKNRYVTMDHLKVKVFIWVRME